MENIKKQLNYREGYNYYCNLIAYMYINVNITLNYKQVVREDFKFLLQLLNFLFIFTYI